MSASIFLSNHRNRGYYGPMTALSPTSRQPKGIYRTIVILILACLLLPFSNEGQAQTPKAASNSRTSRQKPATSTQAAKKKPAEASKKKPASKKAEVKKEPAKSASTLKPTSKKESAKKTPPKRQEPVQKAPAKLWPNKSKPQLGDGTTGSELLINAQRLVGMKNSFTPDSFASHLCYSTALTTKSKFRSDSWASSLYRTLARKRAVSHKDKPKRGDLIFFRLQEKSAKYPSNVLVGVVESVNGSTIRFIAPIGDEVKRARANISKATKRDATLIPCQKGAPCKAGELYLGFAPATKVAFP